MAALPAHADSQPGASTSELPTASCWEKARTGLSPPPGTQGTAHKPGCSERSASNHHLPSGCSLSAGVGRQGPLYLPRRSGCQAGPVRVFCQEQTSLNFPLVSGVDTGLTKVSSAVPAAPCISFTFHQVAANKRTCARRWTSWYPKRNSQGRTCVCMCRMNARARKTFSVCSFLCVLRFDCTRNSKSHLSSERGFVPVGEQPRQRPITSAVPDLLLPLRASGSSASSRHPSSPGLCV